MKDVTLLNNYLAVSTEMVDGNQEVMHSCWVNERYLVKI